MKKILIISCVTIVAFVIIGLFMYSTEKYKNIKIRNANECYGDLAKAVIKNCGEKWGEPGNECRNNFFYKTPCGNAMREVYFPDKKWGALKIE